MLRNGNLSFGVCQKLLNLLLKYHWCAGWIAEPPHFPIDSIIIKKLNTTIRKNKLNLSKITLEGGWTQLNDEKKYLDIIHTASEVVSKTSHKVEPFTLAQWELENFERN